jgi:hypothetical protein
MSSRSALLFFLATLSSLLLTHAVSAQETKEDNRQTFSMIYPSYSIGIPSFDMKDRFGLTQSIGGGYTFMFKNKWLLNADGNFLFGKNVKMADTLFKFIATSDGHIIDQSGTYAQVAVSERGYAFWVKTGKLVPFGKSNPNSGLLIMSGVGFLQHKMRIDVAQNTAMQLRTDYKKGYDHLCNGPALTEFIGYQYLDKAKKINFYAGLDLTLAWTQSRRAYYFMEKMKPDEKRFDMITGIKIGWLVPISRKTGKEYFYY